MSAGSYVSVTELPRAGVTRETLDMLRTRYQIARDLGDGKDVLEVACGPGVGLGYIAQKARRVVAGDFDSNLVQIASAHYGNRLEVRQMNAHNLPFPDASFDLVVFLEAVYYLPQPERFFKEARRVLRKGGTLFVCSANRERHPFNPSPFSHKYFSAKELRETLNRAGFRAEIRAGFPVERASARSKFFNLLRSLAVRYNLIPKTMGGKELIKRILHGKLLPVPDELTDQVGECHLPVPVNDQKPVSDYKVLYAFGHTE